MSSRSRDSGTASIGCISCDTGVDGRSGPDTANSDFTWTTPATLSRWPAMTGNREWPVRAANSAKSATEASASMAITSTLGTMASSACLSASRIDRVSSRTSPSSSIPSCPEETKRCSSSSRSGIVSISSRGSMPRRRTIQLAEPLRNATTGRASTP